MNFEDLLNFIENGPIPECDCGANLCAFVSLAAINSPAPGQDTGPFGARERRGGGAEPVRAGGESRADRERSERWARNRPKLAPLTPALRAPGLQTHGGVVQLLRPWSR